MTIERWGTRLRDALIAACHPEPVRNEIRTTPRVIRPVHGMNERVLLSASLLASIHTPTRFIWGDEDPNGGAEIARRFVGLLPNAELELMPGVGHAPWMDDPDHCASMTSSFLNR